MPDKKDLQYIEADFYSVISEARFLIDCWIQTAKEFNNENDSNVDIESLEEIKRKIYQI